MDKYRKKSIIVEALQYTHKTEWQEIVDFIGEKNLPKCSTCSGTGEYDTEYGTQGCQLCNSRCFMLKTLGGRYLVDWTDWIIKGVIGEFYPCKDEVFWQTYDYARIE